MVRKKPNDPRSGAHGVNGRISSVDHQSRPDRHGSRRTANRKIPGLGMRKAREANAVVKRQVLRCFGVASGGEIFGTGTNNSPDRSDPTGNDAAVRQGTDTDS